MHKEYGGKMTEITCQKCGLTSTWTDYSPDHPKGKEITTQCFNCGTILSPQKSVEMEYFECVRPSGDGTCSDDSCPCGYPGANIPRGSGYFYISKELVEMRSDALTLSDLQKKAQHIQQEMGAAMMSATSGVFMPILMCKLGAKKRQIDMGVAASDAKHWWKTGMAPLRPTPMKGAAQLQPTRMKGGSKRNFFILFILVIVLILFVVSHIWKTQTKTTEKHLKVSPTVKTSEAVKTSIKKRPIFKPLRPNKQLKKPDIEITKLTKIINSDQKNTKALYNRGLLYASKVDLKSALMDFNKAIKLDEARKRRFTQAPDVKIEIERVSNIINKENRNADAFYNRGLLYASKGDLKSALIDYNRSIELKNKDADAYYNRALIYIRKEKFNEAIKDLTKSIMLNSKSANAYCNRGNAYSETNNITLAIRDYNAALKIDPNDGIVYYNRARAHFAIHDRNKVIADLKKSAKYGENWTDSLPPSFGSKLHDPSSEARKQHKVQNSGNQRGQLPHNQMVREGVFVFEVPRHFSRIPTADLERLKTTMLTGGRELAIMSKSADPQLFKEEYLTFFAGYQSAKGRIRITMVGEKPPESMTESMNRNEMFRTNKERIEWGKKTGKLSIDSKGVSKITIGGVPSLLMDIVSQKGERLQTYLFFHSSYPNHSFAVNIMGENAEYRKYAKIIAAFINTLKFDLGANAQSKPPRM